MRIGFAKNDITPRVGVELCGFGPFRCRHSIGIRDRLWARAMAVEADPAEPPVVVVSCDLIGVTLSITRRVRELVRQRAGLDPDRLFLSATHTHSGPNTGGYLGWGQPDPPYVETLPQRIARAAVDALAGLREATLSYAETACEGIGQNREYDKDALPLETVLRDDWRPERPELTDTVCRVLKAESAGRVIGFCSYFGCHPVVCCSSTRFIHGDYCGVATNLLEREHPGSVGLFLQGAQGDVNTCVVHKQEQESLLALDAIASRYANAVRAGLAAAAPLEVNAVRGCRRQVVFARKDWGLDLLRDLLAQKEARLATFEATDSYSGEGWNVRMETVHVLALRDLVAKAERGESLAPPTEVHGLRIGPVALLGAPFETFQAIKNDVVSAAASPTPLVVSFTSDSQGYAPDRTAAARGGYAADTVPLILGQLPYADAHGELVRELLAVDRGLGEAQS